MNDDDQKAERAAIVRSAYNLIGRAGRPASVHEILRAARLSTRAFYRHFSSKDELVLAMYRTDNERVVQTLAEVVAAAPTPRGAVAAWADAVLDIAYDPRRAQHLRVLISPEATAAAGFAAVYRDGLAATRAILVEVLRRGRDDGTFPLADPELDAFAIQAVVNAHLFARLDGDQTHEQSALVAHTVAAFARAMGAPDPAARA